MKLKPIGPNMTELEVNGRIVLFSYKTPVAFRELGLFYRTNKKWSATTSRHINKWLDGETAQEVDQEVLDNLIK